MDPVDDGNSNFADYLNVESQEIGDENGSEGMLANLENETDGYDVDVDVGESVGYIINIEFDTDAGNDLQGAEATFDLEFELVQDSTQVE